MVPEIWNATDRFFIYWVIFCPFNLLTTQKIKILKKRKKAWRYYLIQLYIPKIMIICYTVPEIGHVMDAILIFHFELSFALLLF